MLKVGKLYNTGSSFQEVREGDGLSYFLPENSIVLVVANSPPCGFGLGNPRYQILVGEKLATVLVTDYRRNFWKEVVCE